MSRGKRVEAIKFGPGDTNPGSTILDVAFKYLGVQETPGKPNRGPKIDGWLRFVGLVPEGNAYAWCCAFAVSVVFESGHSCKKTASVKNFCELNKHLKVDVPQPGDLCARINENGTGHIAFFVRNLDGDYVESVDGNTNDAGSREGNQVAIKDRPRAYWNAGFYRPTKA